jgi:hypothetical protein
MDHKLDEQARFVALWRGSARPAGNLIFTPSGKITGSAARDLWGITSK